jgi:cyclic dehypoxanthinyl futalosine synthase
MPIYSPPPTAPTHAATDPGLLRDVAAGALRLTPEQGLELLESAPIWTLARAADVRARQLHGDSIRTYIIDRNINYTNICTAKCTFCAFRRDADDHDAYTLEAEQIHEKIAELSAIGGTQILMQGGMNPALSLEWYEHLLRGIKERFPHINIHAFSPPELIEFVNFFDPPGETLFEQIRWVLARLQAAGLDSLPGGGGEIFAHPVRRKIGLGKCTADAWLTVMHAAHSLGMVTSCTMMFGHIEGRADRVHHMALARQWQDRSLAEFGDGVTHPVTGEEIAGGRCLAFISWPFQRENTPLGRVKDWGALEGEINEPFPGDVVATLRGDGDPKAHPEFGRRVRMAGSVEYLRTQAVSRLMLDNIYSIGSSWVTMGPHVGQTALFFGASDMGSVMMEENVVSSAGTTYCLDEAVLCRLIRDAGFIPAQRDSEYNLIRTHTGAGSPDRKVEDWSRHRASRLHAESAIKPSASADLTVSARS